MGKQEITKRILTDSLKKLMKKKTIERITIKEITDESGLNRQTFYYHFKDIYNQLEWMFEQDVVKLIKKHEGEKIWKEGLLDVFNYFKENREICKCLLRSVKREQLYDYSQNHLRNIFRRTIDELSEGIEIKDKNKEMLADYYVISFIGIMEQWVYGNIKETPEELIGFIDVMIQDQMRGVKLRFKEKKEKSFKKGFTD